MTLTANTIPTWVLSLSLCFVFVLFFFFFVIVFAFVVVCGCMNLCACVCVVVVVFFLMSICVTRVQTVNKSEECRGNKSCSDLVLLIPVLYNNWPSIMLAPSYIRFGFSFSFFS